MIQLFILCLGANLMLLGFHMIKSASKLLTLHINQMSNTSENILIAISASEDFMERGENIGGIGFVLFVVAFIACFASLALKYY